MEYQNIDTDLYGRNEIRRSKKRQYWAMVCILLAIPGSWLFFNGHNSPVWLGLFLIGAFALLTMVCFYLFGDSSRPYYKPGKCQLERTYTYYPLKEQDALQEALQNGDKSALEKIKKSATPEIILVRYSDVEEKYIFSQLKRYNDNKPMPVSDIYFIR